jgi:hypothetical protein
MAESTTLPVTHSPAGRSNGSVTSPPPREVRPARRLPGGRAVVGGFLVAASAVGVFAAYTTAAASPDGSYAVVNVDVQAGDRLSAAELTLVPLDLPLDQRRLAFADLDLLDGATALAPLAAGQLVQTSDVAKPAGAPERAQISLSVDPGNALGGDPTLLGEGERVAVIATYTQAGSPQTATVSDDAIVVRVIDGRDRVGGGAGLTVVLAVTPDDLEPLAQAAAAGAVSIARVTGMAEGTGAR